MKFDYVVKMSLGKSILGMYKYSNDIWTRVIVSGDIHSRNVSEGGGAGGLPATATPASDI